MKHIRDTYMQDNGGKPVISIVSEFGTIRSSIVAKLDQTGEIVHRIAYQPHCVRLMREYLKREWMDHTHRG